MTVVKDTSSPVPVRSCQGAGTEGGFFFFFSFPETTDVCSLCSLHLAVYDVYEPQHWPTPVKCITRTNSERHFRLKPRHQESSQNLCLFSSSPPTQFELCWLGARYWKQIHWHVPAELKETGAWVGSANKSSIVFEQSCSFTSHSLVHLTFPLCGYKPGLLSS